MNCCIILYFVAIVTGHHTATAIKWEQKDDFQVAQNCDFPGDDISKENNIPLPDNCRTKCKELSDCTHFTWNYAEGGICFLKHGGVNKDKVDELEDKDLLCGYKTSPKESNFHKCNTAQFYSTSIEQLALPKIHQFLVYFGKCQGSSWQLIGNYRVSYNCDFQYKDITHESISNADECRKRCSQTTHCTHFTWAKNIDKPICWLKSGLISESDAARFYIVCGYKAKSGTEVNPDNAEKHGGNNGTLNTVVCPNNGVISGYSVRHGWVMDHISLFCTSSSGESMFGPFGGPGGKASKNFEYKCPNNQYISSFYGKAGVFIDKLGVRCRNMADTTSKGESPTDGIVGSDGGADFDDLSYSLGHRPVTIQVYASNVVNSIQVTYGDTSISNKAGKATTLPPIVTEKPKPTGLNEDKCGNRPPSFRIVNGREANPNSWPWMVSLTEIEESETKHLCGASLISSTSILTAAHCFTFKTEDSKYKVRFGIHKLNGTGNNEIVREVSDVIIHEKYPKIPLSPFDIAIVKWKSPLEYSDFVSPICLSQPDKQSKNGTCYVIGWGQTREHGTYSDTLLELELPILPNDQCQKILSDKFNPETQICGAYENGGKDACQGDSGGPLLCEDKNADKWRLQGIVSWGKGCAVKGNPGVYTRVSYYADWIIQHI